MFTAIHPKLPMRNKALTLDYYLNKLDFRNEATVDYPDYLMLKRDQIELHFFLFTELQPKENYGMVYIRCSDLATFYRSLLDRGVPIHPNAPLQIKPWGQQEFSLLDPDNNLLTFGQRL